MRAQQLIWTAQQGWQPAHKMAQAENLDAPESLVIVFGDRQALLSSTALSALSERFPRSTLVGCSTAGEIAGTTVRDSTVVATVLRFERATFAVGFVATEQGVSSAEVGSKLGRSIPHEGLSHAMILSDGLSVNGAQLVRGLASTLPKGLPMTGGLAGDNGEFQRTVICQDGKAVSGQVCIVGFYGPLSVGYGSLGGWDSFGPTRLVTRSKGNVLFELDGEPALALYKRYLGEHVIKLPASGLLFPLSVRADANVPEVVRTILNVSEEDQSLTFAGDIPQGATARLMRANFERIIDGAQGAAQATTKIHGSKPDAAILISCVGRKLVLKQRVEEEVEAVRDILGGGTILGGFYSYGEISPFNNNPTCELHNQTMTITTFSEA